MAKKYELDRYLTFALSQHGEKYDMETCERISKVKYSFNKLLFYLDADTENRRLILIEEDFDMCGDLRYYDSMKCRIILD